MVHSRPNGRPSSGSNEGLASSPSTVRNDGWLMEAEVLLRAGCRSLDGTGRFWTLAGNRSI